MFKTLIEYRDMLFDDADPEKDFDRYMRQSRVRGITVLVVLALLMTTMWVTR